MIITDKAQIKIAELRESNNLRLSGSDELECYELIESDLKLPADATFTRPSVAYLSDGTQVPAGQPRFEDGKFGQGVLIEEGTTNRINPSLFNVYPYLNAIATRTIQSGGEFDGWYKVVATQAGSSGIIAYLGTIFVEVDEQVSFGVDFYSPSGNIKVIVSGSAHAGDMDFLRNYRYGKTWLNDTGAIKEMTVYFQNKNLTPGAINETFYYRFYQVEDKPYATSFIDGTRSSETLTIPTAGVIDTQKGTIAMWVKMGKSSSLAPSGVHDNYISLNAGIWAVCQTNGVSNALSFIVGDSWAIVVGAGVNITWDKGDWLYIVSSWDLPNISLTVYNYTKGTTATATATGATYTATPTLAHVNCGDGGQFSGYTNSIIDELRIDNIARTDEEILAAYQSGKPLPVDEWTTYKLDFDDKVRITTQGQIICNELIEI